MERKNPDLAYARATLTVPEAARFIGVSRNSAYDAARNGQLPVIRVGRRILVLRAALERILKGEE